MAAAGPAGNLLIAVLAFGALRLGLAVDVFVAPDRVNFHHLVEAARGSAMVTALGDLLTVLLVLNILLFIFNMLPVPPLDGASALTGVLPERAALLVRNVNANPAVSLLGLLVAWQVFPQFARPIFTAVLRLVHPGDIYF